MTTLWQDLRYAARMLPRNPGFSLTVFILVAVGVGASTTVFSILYPIMLRPLPYEEPDRIVCVQGRSQEGYTWSVSYPDYLDWRRQATSFDELGCVMFRDRAASITTEEPPEECCLGFVSDNFFRVFGARPALGRFFLPSDDQPAADPVVVLSHTFWQRHFANDPNVLGRPILLDSVNHTIVGVTPRGFDYLPYGADTTDAWVTAGRTLSQEGRRNRVLEVLGKVKAGVSLQQAQVEMQGICARLAAEYASGDGVTSAGVNRLHDVMLSQAKSVGPVLIGTVLMVFLVACANVAGLMFARGVTREREMALRSALGGTRWRLIRLMLLEHMLLVLPGGCLGVVGATWAIRTLLMTGVLPAAQFPVGFFGPDWRALGFALILSVLVVPLCGLFPSFSSSGVSLARSLATGGRTVLGSRARNVAHAGLLAGQTALTIVLLVGAGLMIHSLANLAGADRGFDSRNVLTMELQLSGDRYAGDESRSAFHGQLLDQLDILPGVDKAALTWPLFGGWSWYFQTRNGSGSQPGPEELRATYKSVSPGYFATMQIPLLQGRVFDDRDNLGRSPVVVVDQTLAARCWPDGNWIGRHVKTDTSGDPNGLWAEVIGVVGHVKNKATSGPEMQIYRPLLQRTSSRAVVILRATGDAMGLIPAVKRTIYGMDRQQLIARARTMDDYLWFDTLVQRLVASLLTAFAAVALLLSAAGVYAITRYSVSRRTQEFGIRMALGASANEMFRLVLRKGLVPVFLGTTVGLVGTIAVARVLSGLLYQLSPWDPATYVIVSLVLTGVALAASYLPARRAAKIDPMEALRYE